MSADPDERFNQICPPVDEPTLTAAECELCEANWPIKCVDHGEPW